MVLHGTAADRLALEVGDKKLPRGRPDLVRQSGGTHRGVKSTLRAAIELGDVPPEAVPGVVVLGVDGRDLHAGRRQTALDVMHRRDVRHSLTLVSQLNHVNDRKWAGLPGPSYGNLEV